ncbi:MAG TPA: hypothetical protein VJL28_15810 [Gemmatimonadaceae bacterium]|nr:hypothetical protein [Gemmatimonadaceae bacterium]
MLEPQNPGLVDETAVGTPEAALALRVGAIGRLRNVVHGGDERLWQAGGHMADEYKNADFQPTRADIDRRTIATNNGSFPYTTVTQPRGFVRDALDAMWQFLPDSTSHIGELYMGLGFLEMSLAENFCNGIPLGHTISGDVTLGPPLTNAQVFDSALTHLDSALQVNTKSDAGSVFIRQATLILKARVLVAKGQFAAAAALVPAATVPTSYQYVFTTSTGSNAGLEDNGHWVVQFSTHRMTVSDSFDLITGQHNLIKNALPFASANDPRVPVKQTIPTQAEDGLTPMFQQQLWKSRDDPIPMVSGIDARLIEAEARLNANDFIGMMTILNALRTTSQKIGNYTVPVMAALTTTPTTKDAATTLFFREKGFWTFGRGQRVSDLRRLMRQYGRAEDQVWPTGVYSFGGTSAGTYGDDVNFPVPDGELINPEFKGCMDRLP